jgi:hypothetical protein
MTCVHLKELYRTCERHQLKLSSSDLIRIVCPHCGVQEVCPSMYSLEYDQREEQAEEDRRREAES